MKYLFYFEINEGLKPSEVVTAAQKLLSIKWDGVADVDDYETSNWLITPGNWGILMVETSSIKNIIGAVNMWREIAPGFFKTVKWEPAMPAEEAMPLLMQVAAKVNQAKK